MFSNILANVGEVECRGGWLGQFCNVEASHQVASTEPVPSLQDRQVLWLTCN